MTNCLWLGDPRSFDVSLVGGKVANLSRLVATHRVPDGFCLTTLAFERAQGMASALPNLRDEISAAYDSLSACHGLSNPGMAVRSSAVDEDGSTASFAGQHETYLNISGIEAILDAIVRCWESARAERALEYRKQQGLSAERIRLAVLVQQLIVSDVSAVVFSANPVTGQRDEVMINASWGLGESIVGGTVTPDTFIVNKSDLTISESQIAEKQRMTVLSAGGTQEVDVPRIMRAQPSLDEAQAAEMAQLAIALEQLMGHAVDIECAFANGLLYLLQCRPITTLV